MGNLSPCHSWSRRSLLKKSTNVCVCETQCHCNCVSIVKHASEILQCFRVDAETHPETLRCIVGIFRSSCARDLGLGLCENKQNVLSK